VFTARYGLSMIFRIMSSGRQKCVSMSGKKGEGQEGDKGKLKRRLETKTQNYSMFR